MSCQTHQRHLYAVTEWTLNSGTWQPQTWRFLCVFEKRPLCPQESLCSCPGAFFSGSGRIKSFSQVLLKGKLVISHCPMSVLEAGVGMRSLFSTGSSIMSICQVMGDIRKDIFIHLLSSWLASCSFWELYIETDWYPIHKYLYVINLQLYVSKLFCLLSYCHISPQRTIMRLNIKAGFFYLRELLLTHSMAIEHLPEPCTVSLKFIFCTAWKVRELTWSWGTMCEYQR